MKAVITSPLAGGWRCSGPGDFLLVLGINLLGDWLRDALDPRMERGM